MASGRRRNARAGAWYWCCSTSKAASKVNRDGVTTINRRKSDLARTCALVLDDIGTKVETVRVEQMLPPPSAILETSPGNFQWVYILDGGADPQEAATALERLAAAEITDAGAKDASHVFRLPGSINDKVAVLGNVLRLAGVLTLLAWSETGSTEPPKTVTAEAVEDAAGLWEGYFQPVARAVFARSGVTVADRRVRQNHRLDQTDRGIGHLRGERSGGRAWPGGGCGRGHRPDRTPHQRRHPATAGRQGHEGRQGQMRPELSD